MEMRNNLAELEKLVTNKSNSNLEIIKSHTLEILLSMSEDPNFLSEIENRANLLRTLIISIHTKSLKHKVLLLLVNLSAQKSLANLIVSVGCIKEIFEVLFDSMKRINPEHLEISKSLISEETTQKKLNLDNEGNPKIKNQRILEEKKYKISDQKITNKDKIKMLDLDGIKLSVMILMNCSLLSNQARVQILGLEIKNLTKELKSSDNLDTQLRNLKIVIEWVSHPKIGHLFQNFIFVLTNISSEPQLRKVLVDYLLIQFEKIFNLFEQKKEFEPLLQICQLLRNFSFEYENKKLIKSFNTQSYIPRISRLINNAEFSEFQQNRLQILLIDILWVFHTNIDFVNDNSMELMNFRFDGDKKGLEDLRSKAKMKKLAKDLPDSENFPDKIDGLALIFSNYSH